MAIVSEYVSYLTLNAQRKEMYGTSRYSRLRLANLVVAVLRIQSRCNTYLPR